MQRRRPRPCSCLPRSSECFFSHTSEVACEHFLSLLLLLPSLMRGRFDSSLCLCLCVSLCASLSLCLSLSGPLSLSVSLSLSLSLCLSLCVSLSVSLSLCLSLSVSLCVSLSVFLSLCLSLCVSLTVCFCVWCCVVLCGVVCGGGVCVVVVVVVLTVTLTTMSLAIPSQTKDLSMGTVSFRVSRQVQLWEHDCLLHDGTCGTRCTTGHKPPRRRATGESPWSTRPWGSASASQQECPARPAQLGISMVTRTVLDHGTASAPRRGCRQPCW